MSSGEAQRRAQEKSEEAQRQELSSLLCDGYADLLWAVANENARKVSLALRSILDALDAHDQGEHIQYGEDVFGFCYLLMSLDVRRVLSGDRRVYFYNKAKGLVKRSSRYEVLFDHLLALEGEQVGDDVSSARMFLANLQNAREALPESEKTEFEKAVVTVLLQALEKAAQERISESSQEDMTGEETHARGR